MKGTTGDGQSVAVVHAMLSDAIIGGALPAGSAVSQLALEKDYGVGRTPLREAIRMLQAEGFIVGEPKKRVRIAELTGADAEELFCLRIQLETTAVRQTIPTLSSRDIAEMEGYMARVRATTGEVATGSRCASRTATSTPSSPAAPPPAARR